MSQTNINASLESATPRESLTAVGETVVLTGDYDSTAGNSSRSILRSALDALSDGQVSEIVSQFAERFKFNDHALALEFMEKARLTEYFQKSRELFPDTSLEVVSLIESGDRAIAEWKLSATQIVPFDSIRHRSRVSLFGSTIVRVESGKIVEWSDYYDQASSRRMSLASYFTEWVDY